MTVFAVIALSLAAFALLWIVPPLLRRRAGAPEVARARLNLSLLKEQLAELDADLAGGTLSAEKYAQAREEIQRRVIEETQIAETPAVAKTSGRAPALAMAVVVPLVAGLLYYQLGNPGALSVSGQGAGQEHQMSGGQLEDLATKLAARLEQNPDDAAGWALLARSYYQLRRIPEAVKAYEKATALGTEDATLLADYADALAVSQGGSLEGKPLELVKRALALDPNQWKALALAGTAAFDRKDYREALRYWERLYGTLPPESEMARSVAASIAEARELGGIKDAPKPEVAAASPASKPAPKAAAGASSVAGTVTLNPAFAGKTNASDRVFVFARPAQGSKMPVAIMTAQVKDLPLKFKLDDSMAMQAGMGISSLAEVVVGARIAKSGSAVPQSGDFEGLSKAVKVGTTDLAIVIDKVVP